MNTKTTDSWFPPPSRVWWKECGLISARKAACCVIIHKVYRVKYRVYWKNLVSDWFSPDFLLRNVITWVSSHAIALFQKEWKPRAKAGPRSVWDRLGRTPIIFQIRAPQNDLILNRAPANFRPRFFFTLFETGLLNAQGSMGTIK